MSAQLALTLGQAKAIAVAVVVVLVLAAISWAWLMKTLVQKLVGVLVLAALAGVVWLQRDSLQDCADKVRASADVAGRSVDAACSFFGRDITISARR